MPTMKRLPVWVGVVSYTMFLRPQLLKWGTRLGESQRLLPGDSLIPKPNLELTHAINIDAPPAAVWPWVAQMGRERTGFYGADLWTNQGIPSVTFIRKDIPEPEVNMELDGGFRIIELEANRKLLFGGFSLERLLGVIQDVTTLHLLERRHDGSTRLLVRRRAFSYGTLGMVYNVFYEPLYFIFAQQQLRQIKHHAESMAHLKV